ncbi:hypothetical protein [Candidatus Protochlamydia phocaeensis]|uniref:hypothetical protein n=1 Tax=Candidatus Protochlamydia phocaeensis TaxID=1414722 RepID=UPI00083813B6|nr:hypothetical protein [Candidatus Protochlamydia phocaeensis]
MEIRTGAKKELKRILFLLSAAIICAGLLTVFMLYFYGPTGRYLAGNSILTPLTLSQINLRDKHPQTGQNVRFIFDKNEFSYFDRKLGKRHQLVIPSDEYEQFYHLVSSDKSLENVTAEIERAFNSAHPTLLTTNLRIDVSGFAPGSKIVQIIQFAENDYFRVQLHGDGQGMEWAYFYHSGLYQTIMALFTAHTNL